MNRNEAHVDVALTLSPVYHDQNRLTGFSAVARDIRDQRAAEQERQRLIALVENSPDLIGLADRDKRLVFLNRSGKRMLSMAKVQDQGAAFIADLFSEEDQQCLEKTVMPALLTHGAWSGELPSKELRATVDEFPRTATYLCSDLRTRHNLRFLHAWRET